VFEKTPLTYAFFRRRAARASIHEAVTLAHVGELTQIDALDVTRVHDENADFVWLSLQRLGVREADLEDMLQEVFVVVHRNLRTFDGSSKMTTWLFGICLRVATAYRRRAHRRHEDLVDEVPEASSGTSPEEDAEAKQARAELDRVLDELDVDKRAVFVMFEIDELPCDEIASILGVPVGTVYSRLHAARQSFEKAVARRRARGGRS
jgi:RNA polymerase sigma-70 factor (ECF subfamily)